MSRTPSSTTTTTTATAATTTTATNSASPSSPGRANVVDDRSQRRIATGYDTTGANSGAGSVQSKLTG